MAERELKKMNRSELIEIIYALQREEHELRDRIKQLEEKLTERNIILEKSGSIAEASLRLNKIFEDAQAAADQYVESVKTMVNGEKTFEDPKEKGTDTDVRSLEVEWQPNMIEDEIKQDTEEKGSDFSENQSGEIRDTVKDSNAAENKSQSFEIADMTEQKTEMIQSEMNQAEMNQTVMIRTEMNQVEMNQAEMNQTETIQSGTNRTENSYEKNLEMSSENNKKNDLEKIADRSENDDLEELFNSIEKKLQQELMSFDNIEGDHEDDMFGRKRKRHEEIYEEDKQNDENDIFTEIGSNGTNRHRGLEHVHQYEDMFFKNKNNNVESVDVFDEISKVKSGKSDGKNNGRKRYPDGSSKENQLVYPNRESQENRVVYPNRDHKEQDTKNTNETAHEQDKKDSNIISGYDYFNMWFRQSDETGNNSRIEEVGSNEVDSHENAETIKPMEKATSDSTDLTESEESLADEDEFEIEFIDID